MHYPSIMVIMTFIENTFPKFKSIQQLSWRLIVHIAVSGHDHDHDHDHQSRLLTLQKSFRVVGDFPQLKWIGGIGREIGIIAVVVVIIIILTNTRTVIIIMISVYYLHPHLYHHHHHHHHHPHHYHHPHHHHSLKMK